MSPHTILFPAAKCCEPLFYIKHCFKTVWYGHTILMNKCIIYLVLIRNLFLEFLFSLFLFETASYCVTLTGLKLIMQSRLASNSQRSICLLCFLGAGVTNIHHHARLLRFTKVKLCVETLSELFTFLQFNRREQLAGHLYSLADFFPEIL